MNVSDEQHADAVAALTLNVEVKTFGAEEGTRTPTPLRVRGPEPRASANSATSAQWTTGGTPGSSPNNYFTGCISAVKPAELRISAPLKRLTTRCAVLLRLDRDCRFVNCAV